MQTAKVVGSVTANAKSPLLCGQKLLVVETLKSPRLLVAVDTTFVAGIGDSVYLLFGTEAALALDRGIAPVDASIMGIIDDHNKY